MKENVPSVRPAEFEDVQVVFALIKSYPDELVPRSVSDIVRNMDRFLVCETDGRPTGCVSWQILPQVSSSKPPAVEVKSLAVEAGCQGTGIGTTLIQHAIERIKPLHPSQILVLTFHPDFFRRFGFREVTKEEIMHKIYDGCLNCTKYDSPFTCPEVAMILTLDKSHPPLVDERAREHVNKP